MEHRHPPWSRWLTVVLLLTGALDAGCGGGAGSGGPLNFDHFTNLKPRLSGVVTDAASGGGIELAAVSVEGNLALTDEKGRYWLHDLRVGALVATVAHQDYVTLQRTVVITDSIFNQADFQLQPKP